MQKQPKRNDMEIGLRRLEIISEALALARAVKGLDDPAQVDMFIMTWRRAHNGTGYEEIASLHEDISCRIKTIKEMETL